VSGHTERGNGDKVKFAFERVRIAKTDLGSYSNINRDRSAWMSLIKFRLFLNIRINLVQSSDTAKVTCTNTRLNY
jgi:hypothetical protein